MSKRKKITEEPKTERSPIRFQVSAPEGSAVETALLDVLESVPQPLRAGLNIGTLFRQIIIDNDTEIAKMIRTAIRG